MVISVEHDVLRIVADPTRSQILHRLADGPACVCHLVEELELTQPNVSNHLRALRQAGIVATEPHGRFTYYRLLPEPLEAAAEALAGLAARARASAESRKEC